MVLKREHSAPELFYRCLEPLIAYGDEFGLISQSTLSLRDRHATLLFVFSSAPDTVRRLAEI